MGDFCVIVIETVKPFKEGNNYYLHSGKRTIPLECVGPSVNGGYRFVAECKDTEIIKYFSGGMLQGMISSEAGVVETFRHDVRVLKHIVK